MPAARPIHMDDSENIPEPVPPEDVPENGAARDQNAAESSAELGFVHEPVRIGPPPSITHEEIESRRRSFRHNLLLLLSLSLAAFILTAWILVRVDAPFAMFSTGPQEIARAQLRALDRGELRPAYDMFSARYRQQVSFDVWHELCVTHWRMFHAEVLRGSVLWAVEDALCILHADVFQAGHEHIGSGGHGLFRRLVHRGDALVSVLALVDSAQTFFNQLQLVGYRNSDVQICEKSSRLAQR